MHPARLVAARMLSPTVRGLTFDPGEGFTFVPGQWTNLFLPQPSGEPLRRAYSIASPPRADRHIDLAVTRVEGGPGSTLLHALEPGATLTISDAQGVFTLDPPTRPVLMIGTGTGVAPLRSMLASLRASPPAHRFALLFGVRTAGDVLYGDDLAALAAEWRGFELHPTLSRPGSDWRGKTGHVQAHVAALMQALGGDCDVYVCGLNRMVGDVRKMLREELHLDRKRVHTERYD